MLELGNGGYDSASSKGEGMRYLILGSAILVLSSVSAAAGEDAERGADAAIDGYLARREAVFGETREQRLSAISRIPPVDDEKAGSNAIALATAPFAWCVSERLKLLSGVLDVSSKDMEAVRRAFFADVEVCDDIFANYSMPNARRIIRDDRRAQGYMLGVANMYTWAVELAARDAFSKSR